MGGTLHVESMKGLGSKFSFDLTFETLDSEAAPLPGGTAFHVIEKPIFDADVLVCEDNEMNQQVLREHLFRVGIRTTSAANGKAGIDQVNKRIAEGREPFDLILMDIHMPVMDGLEAAEILTLSGNKTPIVALTANVMHNDINVYRDAGMPDCLPKPFLAQDLWACLLKHLNPVGTGAIDERAEKIVDQKINRQLQTDFLEDHAHAFAEIKNALRDGDLILAHRLAHTLKGVAGLIGKNALKEAAYHVEVFLKENGTDVPEQMLRDLDVELKKVIHEIAAASALEATAPVQLPPVDKEQRDQLFTQLKSMLEIGDSDALEFIQELHQIPGTKTMIERMEHYDFTAALQILNQMMDKKENEYE
jgi:CheY-like chemotaxis protein